MSIEINLHKNDLETAKVICESSFPLCMSTEVNLQKNNLAVANQNCQKLTFNMESCTSHEINSEQHGIRTAFLICKYKSRERCMTREVSLNRNSVEVATIICGDETLLKKENRSSLKKG
jgi:hypothetical protein